MFEIINEIEKKYDVASIRIGGMQIWPFFRIKLYSKIAEDSIGSQKSRSMHLKKIHRNLSSIFYNPIRWFRRYEIFVFSDSSERVKVEGDLMWDRTTDYIIQQIGPAKVLTIEKVALCHYPVGRVPHKNIVSNSTLLIFRHTFYAVGQFIWRRKKKEHFDLLEKVIKEYGLGLDSHVIGEFFYSSYLFYKLFFMLYKPRIIFMNCSYEHMPMIKAANDCGIQTIEVQHGVIGNTHPAYNFSTSLDPTFFPKSLLCYGNYDKAILAASSVFSSCTVCVVGNFYVEWVKNNANPPHELIELKAKYTKAVGVTLQYTVDNELRNFINSVAVLLPTVLFVLIPRPKEDEGQTPVSPENVITWRKNRFYETILALDIHTTVYSSCGIEAPSLGTPNILVDINGLATKYYAERFQGNEGSLIVNSAEEYAIALQNFKVISREEVIKLNEDNIAPDYKERVNEFLDGYVKHLIL